MDKPPLLIQNDPWLEPNGEAIIRHMNKTVDREMTLAGDSSLQSFGNGQPEEKFRFKRLDHGNWEISLDAASIAHGDRYLMLVRWEGGEVNRIPARCTRVVQNPETIVFDAQVWNPDQSYQWKNPLINN